MPIDYDRMNRVWPIQKRALAKAQKIADPEERLEAIKKVCIEAVTEWNEIGAWPDDWHSFNIALVDAQPWPARYLDLQAVMDEHRALQRAADEERRAAERAAVEEREAEEARRYPEHTKLQALGGKNQVIGQFIEWLEEKGYIIAEWGTDSPDDDRSEHRLYPLGRGPQSYIAEYFQIDPAKIEQEKRAMLTEIRAAQGLDSEGVPA